MIDRRRDWQHSVRQDIIEILAADDPKKTPEPDGMEDFGFHFPSGYLNQVCWVLEASHFTMWPHPGGLDDQDSALIADVITWFRLMRRLRWEYEGDQWHTPHERATSSRYNAFSEPH